MASGKDKRENVSKKKKRNNISEKKRTNEILKEEKKAIVNENSEKRTSNSSWKFKIYPGIAKFTEVVSIVSLVVIASFLATKMYCNKKNEEAEKNDKYVQVRDDEHLKEFVDVYESVTEDTIHEVDKGELIGGAIEGMLNTIQDEDGYAVYLDKENAEEFDYELNRKFRGIGVRILNADNSIIEVFEESPAEAAGIQVGDIIVKVNDREVESLGAQEISEVIRDNEGIESLDITVRRNGEDVLLHVGLGEITEPASSSEILEGNIAHLNISIFSEDLKQEIVKKIAKYNAEGIKNVIIDVRGNSGGLLTSAEEVASLFLEKGKTIYSYEDKNGVKEIKDETDEATDFNIVVLIDSGSASAAELFTAALKDSYSHDIKVYGTNSFGKGTVQQVMTLSDGSKAKFTVGKWSRPAGNCIDNEGITPDVEVEFECSEVTEDGICMYDVDTQLAAAMKAFNN